MKTHADPRAVPAPAPPTNVKAVSASDTAIDVSYTPSISADVVGNLLFRRAQGVDDSVPWDKLNGGALVTASPYRDSGLAPGSSWCYRLRAVAQGESDASNVASATTPGNGTSPAPPTNVRATNISADTNKVEWDASPDAGNGYLVHGRDQGADVWTDLTNTVPTLALEWIDSGLPPYTMREYQVTCCQRVNSGSTTAVCTTTTGGEDGGGGNPNPPDPDDDDVLFYSSQFGGADWEHGLRFAINKTVYDDPTGPAPPCPTQVTEAGEKVVRCQVIPNAETDDFRSEILVDEHAEQVQWGKGYWYGALVMLKKKDWKEPEPKRGACLTQWHQPDSSGCGGGGPPIQIDVSEGKLTLHMAVRFHIDPDSPTPPPTPQDIGWAGSGAWQPPYDVWFPIMVFVRYAPTDAHHGEIKLWFNPPNNPEAKPFWHYQGKNVYNSDNPYWGSGIKIQWKMGIYAAQWREEIPPEVVDGRAMYIKKMNCSRPDKGGWADVWPVGGSQQSHVPWHCRLWFKLLDALSIKHG